MLLLDTNDLSGGGGGGGGGGGQSRQKGLQLLQQVIPIECVLYCMCPLQNVSSIACVLDGMCSLRTYTATTLLHP
jgi:hypothetical protein